MSGGRFAVSRWKTMIRVGLIAYLLVATIAGPAWCCCTLAKVASSAFQAVGKKSTETSKSSCCSQKPLREDDGKGSKGNPSDQPDKCPCKESRDLQPVIFVAPDSADQSQQLVAFNACDFYASSLMNPVSHDSSSSTLHGPTHLPFSGRDILLAFQTFRC